VPRSRRAGIASGAAVLSLAAATAVLLPFRAGLSLPSIVLLYLVPVLLAAAAGGLWPALGAAVAAALVVNWFFVPPYRTLAVATGDDIIALVVYLLVAAAAGLAVDRTAARAVETERLARVDRMRTALLGAAGHELRTPLAGIKAAVSSLRQDDVEFSAADRAELLATVEESTDRLTAVVDNLLSLSRLRAGVLSVDLAPTALDAVAAQAALGAAGVTMDVPDDLPAALADAGLLEHVLVNLIANARAVSPTVTIRGTRDGDQLNLAVIDHGPGIPAAARDAVFAPFQRLDGRTGDGLGLGLAIARGFTEAQGGTLEPGDTPGGGLTMTITLPAVRP
jgi:two-component system sensor histidine kinase KdpD